MRHGAAIVGFAAIATMADQQRRYAQAEAKAVGRSVASVHELSRRLAEARHEVRVLEDEIQGLDAELIALRRENAMLKARLSH
jgi:predicted RNase H-like nuclease (RuvC/YqgF family)